MRLGMCKIRGQVVSSASSTPASATSATSRPGSCGEGIQRAPRAARAEGTCAGAEAPFDS